VHYRGTERSERSKDRTHNSWGLTANTEITEVHLPCEVAEGR